MKRIFASLLAMAMLFQAPAFAALRFGQGTKTVASAGTALALLSTETTVSSLTVCGDSGNTGKIAVAQTPVAAAGSQQGVVLSPGGCVVIEGQYGSLFDAASIKVDSTVSGEEATFFWIREER